MTIINILKDCHDLKNFSIPELEEIAKISKLVNFEKGHDVFSVEHGDKYLFIVADGLLSLRLHQEHRSKEFNEKDLFGEIVLFSDRGRLGAIRCLEKTTLLAIDKTKILEENEVVSTSTRFNFLRKMGEKMAGYLYQENKKDVEDLITEMESECLEFKASIYSENWNPMTRTIAGFMNVNGGSIICGIRDDGKFASHTPTRKEVDTFEQKFRVIINQHLGDCLPEIHFDFKPIGQHKIVKIDIEASSFPIFYREYKDQRKPIERFYIRTGNKNHPIRMASEVVTYIQNRFESSKN